MIVVAFFATKRDVKKGKAMLTPYILSAHEKEVLQVHIGILNRPGYELSSKINAIQLLYDLMKGNAPKNYAYCEFLNTIPGLYKNLRDMTWFNRNTAENRTLDMLYDFISCFDSLPHEHGHPSSVECCFFKNKVEPEPEVKYLKWRHARDQYKEQELLRLEAVKRAEEMDRIEGERLRAHRDGHDDEPTCVIM